MRALEKKPFAHLLKDLSLRSGKRNSLRDLATLIVLSSIGGITSVLVGYAGQLLSQTTPFPFVTSQLLSGLHVFWLILAAIIVPKHGSATTAGALKGLIEAAFFSHLGLFSFLVSLGRSSRRCSLRTLEKRTQNHHLCRGRFVIGQQPLNYPIFLFAAPSDSNLCFSVFCRFPVRLTFRRLPNNQSAKSDTRKPLNHQRKLSCTATSPTCI